MSSCLHLQMKSAVSFLIPWQYKVILIGHWAKAVVGNSILVFLSPYVNTSCKKEFLSGDCNWISKYSLWILHCSYLCLVCSFPKTEFWSHTCLNKDIDSRWFIMLIVKETKEIDQECGFWFALLGIKTIPYNAQTVQNVLQLAERIEWDLDFVLVNFIKHFKPPKYSLVH